VVAFIPKPASGDDVIRSPTLIAPFSRVTFTGTRPTRAMG
jgi:hypothetical protein